MSLSAAAVAGIWALVATTVGVGTEAVGGSISAADAEKERKRLAKLGQTRWEEEQKLAERSHNLKSVKTLADQRMGLQQKSFRRSFNKDFLRAVQFRQNQPKGPGVTTLGGR